MFHVETIQRDKLDCSGGSCLTNDAPLTAEILLAGIAIAFLAAACYAVTGFGFALVMTPLLAVVWEVKSAVVTSVVLSTVALLPLLVEVRAHVPVARAFVLVLGSFAGIPLGVLILQQLESDALQALVAATVIVAALLLYFRPSVEPGPDTRSAQLAAGFVSGVVGGSTSMGGPPIVLYLIGREREVEPFRATLLAFFLPGSLLQIAILAGVGRITGEVLLLVAAALPAVVAGLLAGAWLRRHVQPERFRAVVVAVLIVTSTGVLVSALL
jgi:uncharacterized membrane protein YfcA